MPFVSGFLRVRRGGGGRPDNELPGGESEVDPGYGIEEHPPHVGGGPIYPDVDPPDPPPGIWPPLTPENPWRPVDPGWGVGHPRPPHVGGGPAQPPGRPPHVGGGPARPERPTDPGYGIDEGAGVGGGPARPPRPTDPGYGIDEGAEVGGGPVLPPGMIWPPLPGGVHGKYLALIVVFGVRGGPRYRYTVIDADLRPDQGLPGGGGGGYHPDQGLPPDHGYPDNTLPETPEPKG